ncbi:MAG: MATE family multidrug resistance protein [Alteromonas naphthalenivorans]|jgi:MATE family multidrug resistance protein
MKIRQETMKKNIVSSYMAGVKDSEHGQGFGDITRYFIPEFISAVILYSVPLLIDARWIAHLQSTSAYATLGITNTLLHSIIKIAEGISVGTIIMTGQLNGVGHFKRAGNALINSFWTTVLTGGCVASLLFLGASRIYVWYGVPAEMVVLGVPFLRIRAIGIFFTFVYFAFIGFLRGIKDTETPMNIFILGSIVFLFFDYALIFGAFGFPAMGLLGSAIASVAQYSFMTMAALFYVIKSDMLKKYEINLFSAFASWDRAKELFSVSWPVMIDKAALSCSYVWLGYCLAPMGTCALASFSVVKDLERFALLPAIAFAQVITFLVSNYYGKQEWDSIKSTIKKIVFMSSIGVFIILFCCSLWPTSIIQIFDFKGEFTSFAAKAFPIISVLAFFDVLQLILAGALRGAANVRVVMWTRLIVCGLIFAPMAYGFSCLNTQNTVLKFILVYSSLYVCNAFMSLIYIKRFRQEAWKQKAVKGIG